MTSSTHIIPLPLFFGKPPKDQVRLSPLGTWLGYRRRDPKTGILNLWIQNRKIGVDRQITFETPNDSGSKGDGKAKAGVCECLMYWFSPDDETLIYLREYPKPGTELYHLYAIDLLGLTGKNEYDSGSPVSFEAPVDLLAGQPHITCAMGFAGGLQVWLDANNPRHIYTSTAACGIRSLFWNITRIHLDTRVCEIVALNPLSTWMGLAWFLLESLVAYILRNILGLKSLFPQPRATVQWFPDRNMDFRGKLEISLSDLSCSWRVRAARHTKNDNSQNNEEEWVSLHEVSWADANMSLVGSTGGSGTAHFDFGQDGSTVDVHLCNMGDTTTYERYEVATGKHIQHLACHSQSKSDITGFLCHPRTKKVEAVVYNYEKPTIQCLADENDCPVSLQKDVAFLQQEFQGASLSIVSRTLDDRTWVVHVQSDVGLSNCLNAPSGYFLFHRHLDRGGDVEPSSLEFLLSSQSALQEYQLGTMEPVHIPARDGEDLLCYLSRPPSSVLQKPDDPTHLVLLIHGGPQARDVWQYHPLCQLLCNRGMSVLQVNYRGSTGLGTRFMKIGMDGAFAAGVQQDIQDAANYALQQKWCLPNHLAIMGGSFGGYSTLAAMTFMSTTPESPPFQCAVAICPPSVMGAANTHKAFYGNPLIAKYWKQVHGPEIATSIEASKAVSPLYHMDKLNRPLLLLHGEDDPRVPIEQTDELMKNVHEAKKNKGGDSGVATECEYIKFAKEGHGIRKEQNQLLMYHHVERFLCRHLKLPAPPSLESCWIEGHTGTMASSFNEESQKDKKVQ